MAILVGGKLYGGLPQALKWAALRLRTIIIISSDGRKEEGGGGPVEERVKELATGREDRGGGRETRGARRGRRSGRIYMYMYTSLGFSNRSDVVVNIFTGSLTSRREATAFAFLAPTPPGLPPSLRSLSRDFSHSSALPFVIRAPAIQRGWKRGQRAPFALHRAPTSNKSCFVPSICQFFPVPELFSSH